MDARGQATEILKQHGAILSRQRKHQVWKFPDGRTWVRANTPSDYCANANSLSHLRSFLGLHGDRGIEGERRERRAKTRKPTMRLGSLAGAKVNPNGLESLRELLMSAVKVFQPKHKCCYPIDRRVVLQTPVSVWLSRWFA